MTHPPASPSVEPDWQAVAHDYSARILSVQELCVLHGIHLKQLYERVADEGWPRRQRVKRSSLSRILAAGANMPHRLLRALDMKMTELETYMAANTETSSPADFERNVRTLNTLAGLFEKLKKQAYLDQTQEQKGPRRGYRFRRITRCGQVAARTGRAAAAAQSRGGAYG